MTLYVGIDPGKSGYISFYSTDLNELEYEKLPSDFDLLYGLLAGKNQLYRTICGLEKATAYKGQGAKSINTYLINFGALLGFLEILDYKVHLIPPRTWQAYFNLKSSITIPKKVDRKTKNKLRYQQKKELKQKSIELANKIWGLDIKDHNLADSLLILRYIMEIERQKNE